MRVYARAGVFAEGRTDYDFLLPLLDRLLDALAASMFPGNYEIGATIGIDAPRGTEGGRAEKIAAAIRDAWEECTVFVVHSDGAGDPDEARRTCVAPGLDAARGAMSDRAVVAAACVPVREIEAWMLTDPEVFRTLLGGAAELTYPADPEREIDPKRTLRRLLDEGGARRAPERLYALFGERVRLGTLRALPAFRAFEAELVAALQEVARLQGIA